jgi:hypothetical protein
VVHGAARSAATITLTDTGSSPPGSTRTDAYPATPGRNTAPAQPRLRPGFSRLRAGEASLPDICEVVDVSDDRGRRPTRRVEEQIGHGEYGPGALDEVTVPPADEVRESQERDIDDPADVRIDPDELRDGGPTRSPGALSTLGDRRPAREPKRGGRPRGKGKVAPTTTGDAGTGGMSTPAAGSTSDAASTARQIGNFTER